MFEVIMKYDSIIKHFGSVSYRDLNVYVKNKDILPYLDYFNRWEFEEGVLLNDFLIKKYKENLFIADVANHTKFIFDFETEEEAFYFKLKFC